MGTAVIATERQSGEPKLGQPRRVVIRLFVLALAVRLLVFGLLPRRPIRENAPFWETLNIASSLANHHSFSSPLRSFPWAHSLDPPGVPGPGCIRVQGRGNALACDGGDHAAWRPPCQAENFRKGFVI